MHTGTTDAAQRAAHLVIEVNGDFCRAVRTILKRHGRERYYFEINLDCPYRIIHLHDALEAYAPAYGIASLLNNFLGGAAKSNSRRPIQPREVHHSAA